MHNPNLKTQGHLASQGNSIQKSKLPFSCREVCDRGCYVERKDRGWHWKGLCPACCRCCRCQPATETCWKGNQGWGPGREIEKPWGHLVGEALLLRSRLLCCARTAESHSPACLPGEAGHSLFIFEKRSVWEGSKRVCPAGPEPAECLPPASPCPAPPLPSLPALRWADRKSCQLGCQGFKGTHQQSTQRPVCSALGPRCQQLPGWRRIGGLSSLTSCWYHLLMEKSPYPSCGSTRVRMTKNTSGLFC